MLLNNVFSDHDVNVDDDDSGGGGGGGSSIRLKSTLWKKNR